MNEISKQKTKEVYDFFISKEYKYPIDDLSFSEPNEDENDYYVCCEQKIIRWNADLGKFTIACLYNSFETICLSTKEEIYSFFMGYKDGDIMDAAYFFHENKELSPYDLGAYYNFSEIWGRELEKEFKKIISPIQIRYPDITDNVNQ